MDTSEIVNLVLSSLTVIAQFFILIGVISYVCRKQKWAIALHDLFSRKGVHFALIVALVATLGSLTYSEILHYDPCKLCWLERIFMYPNVLLLSMTLVRDARKKYGSNKLITLAFKLLKSQRSEIQESSIVKPYINLLLVPGLLLSIYHYSMQIGLTPELPCSAVGYTANCAKIFVLQYGYITIPLMAATAFALMLCFLNLTKRS